MTVRDGDPIWTRLAPLDVEAEQAMGIYDLLSEKIRRTHRRTAESLRSAFPEVATRIESVLDTAPQVLSYGAAYQWVTRLHVAVTGDDQTAFDELQCDFSRFECAAAMLAGADFDGELPGGQGVHERGAPLVVPLVGTFRLPGPHYTVRAGVLDAQLITPPRIGALRVDAFEANYRLARSKSQFDLDDIGHWELGHSELLRAHEIADTLVPGLFDRYLTDVVPLRRDGRISNAGTDEAAPFTVYTSFERDPVDMVACLAHEEAHALINSADKVFGGKVLPDTADKMPVPWKPGMMRSLSDVMHGLISFGRAAQVRTRAAAAGLDSPDNQEARLREIDWVRTVTGQLQGGILGPLPDWLNEWMTENLDRWTITVPPGRGPEVVARGHRSNSMFPWLLWSADQSARAATDVYGQLSAGAWARGSGAFADQDRIDLDIGRHPHLRVLLADIMPKMIADEFGDHVELDTAKAHRIRRGDRIATHSDDGTPDTAYRAVLGASPVPTDGGLLRLCDPDRRPVVAVPLRLGDCLIFNTEGVCQHEVTELKSGSFRYTVVASYRHVADGR